MTLDHAARRAMIAQTLEEARLSHAWAPGPEPVATLALQLPDRPILELTVRHTGTVMQLIAHRILPGPRDPQRIADVDVLAGRPNAQRAGPRQLRPPPAVDARTPAAP